MPFGQFARTIYTKYPEYHTSKDDLEFTNIKNLYDSAYKIFNLIKQFEDTYKKYETDKENIPEILYTSSDNEEFYHQQQNMENLFCPNTIFIPQ